MTALSSGGQFSPKPVAINELVLLGLSEDTQQFTARLGRVIMSVALQFYDDVNLSRNVPLALGKMAFDLLQESFGHFAIA